MNCSFYLKGRLTEQGGGGTSIRWPWYTRQDKRQDADEQYTLHLTSRRKWNSKGTSRVKSTQETLADVIPICRDIGVTRIADITYMDRLYIPNYSVVLPGTEDKIWVYGGKGPTKQHAMASALMECIERYSSLPSTNSKRPFITGSFEELSKKYKVLHPDSVIEPLSFQYENDMVMDFMFGFDLLSNDTVLVPAALALWRYSISRGPSETSKVVNPYAHEHTNGLASGNVIEEAVCHALCEVIERDAWSLAELRASVIPYNLLKKIMHSLCKNGYLDIVQPVLDKFSDDNSIFPDVDITEVEQSHPPVKELVNRFAKVDIPLLIKDITSNIGIPTFHASSIEWITHDYGYFVYGIGTHPDARIALVRAITEVSQNRAGNIQGARDDLRKVDFKLDDFDHYKRTWQFTQSRNKIKFSDVKTYINENILDDIRLILNRLKESGFNSAIIVDLTNPHINIPVVRAIVPGLESFQVTKSVMGRRAIECFKKNLMNVV